MGGVGTGGLGADGSKDGRAREGEGKRKEGSGRVWKGCGKVDVIGGH